MTRNTLRIVALAAAAIIAIVAGAGSAAADGDHTSGTTSVLQHLRDHIANAPAELAAAQAAVNTINSATGVTNALAAHATARSAYIAAELAHANCHADSNCIPPGTSGSQQDAVVSTAIAEQTARAAVATARAAAAAAIDSDSDGDETYSAFVTALRRAESAASRARHTIWHILHTTPVNDAPSGRCRITLDAVPENRRFHVWSSGTVCWDRNGDGDFDDAGEIGSLLMDE